MRFSATGLAAALVFSSARQLSFVHAHGGHGDGPKEGESAMDYAERHMVTEHHIDAFDLHSFLALHDLDSNGVLDASEIEAIYGVHHSDSQKKSPDEAAHKAKADKIVSEVLAKMDKNKDGVLSPEEFESFGMAGLPDYSSLGAEGHHYDEESEFFLHHEEQYHNTPETQTDDSYIHPEDIEHFSHHEQIELREENKERAYQGLSELTGEELEKLHAEQDAEAASSVSARLAQATEIVASPEDGDNISGNGVPKVKRPGKPDPKDKLKGAYREAMAKGEWGIGEQGFAPPKSPTDRLRKNVPYKYKFRRNWGDF